MKRKTSNIVGLALLSAMIAGCNNGSDARSDVTGTLSLSLTDAPVDNLLSVFLTFTGLAFQSADGQRHDIVFPEPRRLDLLTLQNGDTISLVEAIELPAGKYSWLRLDLSEETGSLFVKDNLGGQYNLTVPSGAQTGLKLVGGFSILANGQSDFTIDFDLRKSVTLTGTGSGTGDYILRPTLRLVDNAQAGAIGGLVDTELVRAHCDNPQLFGGVIYIFERANVVVNDYNANSGGALVAVPVSDGDGDGTFSYMAAFLPGGEYTAAYTCDIDDLLIDENLTFTPPVNVLVSAGASATVNF
ncbi:DUF4382 domain-containing protein [Allohahella marinimesophila]|uniref:DUF4382 domain-containing protein n=1 Tax=Allohahella marinimesophila TaxID=1054972 RepID=A0ABP7P416_9GAMM